LWQLERLGIGPVRAHIVSMSNGTQITINFKCPCGMNYTATQEQCPEAHSGGFDCTDCGKSVYEWSGNTNYSNWKAITMKPTHPWRQI
jgi:predicted SprT family Zn-dependent metalloprotease